MATNSIKGHLLSLNLELKKNDTNTPLKEYLVFKIRNKHSYNDGLIGKFEYDLTGPTI